MQAPLINFTTPKYWKCYYSLPSNVRDVADNYFSRLKQNPMHPSLHLKKILKNKTPATYPEWRADASSGPAEVRRSEE